MGKECEGEEKAVRGKKELAVLGDDGIRVRRHFPFHSSTVTAAFVNWPTRRFFPHSLLF